jgi:hypothetical protein
MNKPGAFRPHPGARGTVGPRRAGGTIVNTLLGCPAEIGQRVRFTPSARLNL